MPKEILEEFNYEKTERKIIGLLFRTQVPMTVYEIAKRVEVTPPTANKYVNNLLDLDVIISVIRSDEKQRYKFNFKRFAPSPGQFRNEQQRN